MNIPRSKYAPDAMLVCAKIQRDQLGDYAGATRTYQDFLKRYPHSSRKHEAQEGIAELAMLQNSARAFRRCRPARVLLSWNARCLSTNRTTLFSP